MPAAIKSGFCLRLWKPVFACGSLDGLGADGLLRRLHRCQIGHRPGWTWHPQRAIVRRRSNSAWLQNGTGLLTIAVYPDETVEATRGTGVTAGRIRTFELAFSLATVTQEVLHALGAAAPWGLILGREPGRRTWARNCEEAVKNLCQEAAKKPSTTCIKKLQRSCQEPASRSCKEAVRNLRQEAAENQGTYSEGSS